MMNKIKILLFLFLNFAATNGFSQSPPIEWSFSSLKIANNTYNILINGKISKGWYVYAAPDSINGLTGPQIKCDNENIRPGSEINIESIPKKIHDRVFNNKSISTYADNLTLNQNILFEGTVPDSLKIKIYGFAANGEEFLTIDEVRKVYLEGGTNSNPKNQIKLSTIRLDKPVADCGGEEKASKGILAIFLLGVAGGLIALLTPCVFPMIPVTVSFFTNRAKSKKEGIKNGLMYGSAIFLIYVLASLPFHLIGNISPEILNSISTNAWVNVVFFLVFIFFSLSFFGLFEITLPSHVVNKTDSKSSLGSLAGIFFMALTLATVSFSCTGPILGSLLVGSLSANGGAWQLTAGMSGFGLALALPFGLFAMFPNWLKKMPKSGGWLNTVKKVLAFAELALAFKFLSNADLVQHWGILKREVFIGIWILISAGLVLYLFGLFEKDANPSTGRKFFGVLMLLFTIYLIPGLTRNKYANLKLLSGFPPPLSYSLYESKNEDEGRLVPDVMNDYAKALALSKKENKPILIDFTGWACVNCRKMEDLVWTNPEISSLIKNNFILLSLYVDDRKKLPQAEQFLYKTADGNEKEIITAGDQWATFQSENFKQVTQPLYVILSPEEVLLNSPVGYTPQVNKYKQWLECGLKAEKEISRN